MCGEALASRAGVLVRQVKSVGYRVKQLEWAAQSAGDLYEVHSLGFLET